MVLLIVEVFGSVETLKVLAGLGFPAWALVVAWGVFRVSGMFNTLFTRMSEHSAATEKRLVLLEEIVRRHDRDIEKIAERHP
jgi:hypothetical protein